MKKQKYMNLVIFFAGVLVTLVLMFVFATDQKSQAADQYSCIRQDLNAQGMTGNIPDPAFTITYDVPRCYLENGYTVERVYMYGSQIAVRYAKK